MPNQTGTDIYFMSGTRGGVGKPVARTNRQQPVMEFQRLFFGDGSSIVLPVPMINYIRANYARKRAQGIGFTITADSEPDYDNWGPDDYWGCADWMLWHQANVAAYGKETANQKFISAWGAQDSFMSPYNWCKYNAGFADYFAQQGIDVGWLLSHLIVAVQDIPDAVIDAAGNLTDAAGNILATAEVVAQNIADSAGNVSSGVKGISTVVKYVAPFAVVAAGVWAVDKWAYPIFPKTKRA